MKRPGNSFRYTDDVQQKIVAEYETTDVGRVELALRYGISVSTVDAYRRRWAKKE